MTAVAVLAAMAAVWWGLGPPPAARIRARSASPVTPRLAGLARAGPIVIALTSGLLGLASAGVGGAAMAMAVVAPALTAGLLWRRHRAARASAQAETEVTRACQQLAGLLRVGHVPATALGLAARDSPVLAAAAAAHAVGGDVPGLLRDQALAGGRAGLAQLAAAWEVAERTGASLTATLDALAERMRAERSVQATVAAELSAARATGRLLAVLPLAGIALGYGVGGDPVGFLTGSLAGQACLVTGSLLGCLGVLWSEHIASTP